MVREGWGKTSERKNCEGGALVVDEQTYSDGIGTHAPSVIVYTVPEGTERFRAIVAPDDMGTKRNSATELEFQVWLEPAPTGSESQRELQGQMLSPETISNIPLLSSRKAVLEQFSKLPEFTFEGSEDRWWHSQLAKLVTGIQSLADAKTGLFSIGTSPDHGWGIMKRADFARTIAERSVSGSEASVGWSAAIASIGSVVECPLYGGLRITPQLGLLPIGPDPDSHLWEFAHLATGEPAVRGPDGLALKESTGLVFVLLPGGTFWMGAQSADPGGRNYDPDANSEEGPVHAVTLSPFFLSKYEMTQGQWLRFTGSNPSRDNPETYGRNWNREGKLGDLLHPVEQVTWTECTAVLERLGLELPREAQWEYGARAGTTTVWWSGNEKESIASAGNLADQYAKTHGGSAWTVEDWDDGHSSHAPVGKYLPNAFGLHDVIGNVWEWCQGGAGSASRFYRGGGLQARAVAARSACRPHDAPSNAGGSLGLRPARALLAP